MIILTIPLACVLALADGPPGLSAKATVDAETAAAETPAVTICSLNLATCRIPRLRPELAARYPAGCSGIRSFRICSGASFAADEYIPRTCWVKVNAEWNLPNDKTPSVSPVPGVLICP